MGAYYHRAGWMETETLPRPDLTRGAHTHLFQSPTSLVTICNSYTEGVPAETCPCPHRLQGNCHTEGCILVIPPAGQAGLWPQSPLLAQLWHTFPPFQHGVLLPECAPPHPAFSSPRPSTSPPTPPPTEECPLQKHRPTVEAWGLPLIQVYQRRSQRPLLD